MTKETTAHLLRHRALPTLVALLIGLQAAAAVLYFRGTVAEPRFGAEPPTMRILGPSSECLVREARKRIRTALTELEAPTDNISRGMETYESQLIDAGSLMKQAVLSDVLSSSALLGLAASECELNLIQREPDAERCPALLAIAERKEPFNAEYQLRTAEMCLRAGLSVRGEALAARAIELRPSLARMTFDLLASYGYEPAAVVDILTATPDVLVAAHDHFLERGLSESYLATVERADNWTRPLLEAYADVAFKERAFDRVIVHMSRLGPNSSDDVEATRLGLTATSLLATGHDREAMSAARKALTHRPDDPILLELVGDCQSADSQWNEAIGSHRQALSSVARGTASKGQMARLYRKIGEDFVASGDGARAFDFYRQSLSLAPDDPITRERLREITQPRVLPPRGVR